MATPPSSRSAGKPRLCGQTRRFWTVLFVCLFVTVFFSGAYSCSIGIDVGSNRWHATLMNGCLRWVHASSGVAESNRFTRGVHFDAASRYLLRFRPLWFSQSSTGLDWCMFPLWPLVVLAGLLATGSWLCRRRWLAMITRGHCDGCGYSRQGIEPEAVCPECGRPGTGLRAGVAQVASTSDR